MSDNQQVQDGWDDIFKKFFGYEKEHIGQLQIQNLFNEFLKTYLVEEKEQVWQQQSTKFKRFWSDKILADNTNELNDYEIDEIVKILDRNGKGNTKTSEAVARVMIPQGAWRRMFKEIKSHKRLAQIINSIFTETNLGKKAELINKLYEENKGKKNNLTGQSGNAINSMLVGYDPVNNSSIISLKDRMALIKKFKIGNVSEIEAKSLGERIVITNTLVIEGLKAIGLSGSARTLSVFCYSQSMKDLWKTPAPDEAVIEAHAEEAEAINTTEQPITDNYLFYMESQLEDFLIKNWEKTDLGKKYDLIMENDELVSQQYRTDIGIIDILAKDKESGRYVVIELKRDQTSDATVGQLTRYMGWIEDKKSEGKPTKGVIIASQFDERLYYAIKKVPDVEVYQYKVDFHLEQFNK